MGYFRLLQVGDRPLTDIVYGNQNGFLTILTEPLSLNEEPFIVRQVSFCFFSKYFSYSESECCVIFSFPNKKWYNI